MNELTEVELIEFSYLNMLAFEIACKQAIKDDIVIPRWLCMNPTAKARHRGNALDLLSILFLKKFGLIEWATFYAGLTPKQMSRWTEKVNCWKKEELQAKIERENGNPAYFFVTLPPR